ncbi:hypothetical protein GmHk_17G049540 [Glycine max]|nr:hypothetical protein GmHk_17G049540 [Glycine max]
MIQLSHFCHSMRVFTRCGMQGVWLWVILRALQSVLPGYTTNCLPFSGISEARLEVGWILVGNFMCLPHGLRDMYMMRLSALNEYGSGVIGIFIGSGHRVHLSNSAGSGNCNRISFHYLLHAHHGLHHCGHLLFHGLHVGLHLLLHLLYFTHYSSSSTSSKWVYDPNMVGSWYLTHATKNVV